MASHEISKLVDGSGDEFNFRDPTKESLANKVTSVRASSSASNTNYPSEKAVATALDKKIPFDYAIFDTNPFGGKHLYINSISDAMFSMDKRYYVTATTHKIVDNGVEYPRIKEGAVETDDVYYEDSPVLGALTDSQIRSFFNGHYDSGFAIGDGKYLKIHIQFSNEANWSPSTGGYFPGYPYGDYFLSFYYNRVPESAQWRCYNRYTTNPQTAGWKKGNFGYFEGTASSVASVILKGTDNSNYQRSCIEIIVFARDGVNTMLTQIDWRLSRPTLADHFPLFTNFAAQKSYVNWEFRQKASSSPVIKIDVDNEKIVSKNLELTNALRVSYGGTGKSSVTSGNYLVGNGTSALTEKTPKDAGSDVLKSLDTDNGDVVDGDYIVTSYHVNASTISSTTFVRRTAEKLWNYIQSKISIVLGLSTTGYTGNAATATTAQNYDTSTGTIKTALAGKSDTGHVHNTDANEVTDSAVASTLDVVTDTTEIVTTNTAGYGNSSTQDKKLYRRPIKSKLWPWIKGLLSSDTGVNVSGSSASCTGNAATASAAASGSALETAINGKAASSHTHKTDAADVTSDDTNLGDATDGMQFVTTYADNTGYSSQHKELYRRPGIKIWNWIKSKIDSYTGVVHTTGDETVQGLKTFSNTTTGNDLDINLQSVTNNGTYKMGVEVAASGRRGLWDYGGTGISGEGKWIIYKDTDNVVHVGDASAEPNTIRLGKLTIDTSGTIGNASNTLYIG